MLKHSLILLISIFTLTSGFSQTNNGKRPSQQDQTYKAVYQLDSNDPKIIEKTIRNISNVLEDPRLKNNLKVELVTFAGGTEALLKKNKQYEKPMKTLVDKGVTIVQCENSIREQNRSKGEFFDFIDYVPSGNGELIIRQKQGWAIIKP